MSILQKIIILTGNNYCGKTTVSEYIHQKYDFPQIAIATYLKDITAELFNIDRRLYDTHNAKDGVLQLRDQLIAVATSYKQRDLQFFMNHVKKIIDGLAANHHFIVINDLRFQHEMDFLIEQYGISNLYIVHLMREKSDISLITPIHKVIINDGSKDELFSRIDALLVEVCESFQEIKKKDVE